jgi:glycine cleavage system aminomethyltransferase T
MGGLDALLFRLSFSGELAYELAVPARYGDAVIRAVMTAGEAFGIAPYGTEALGVMRIEKGHISTNEINGQTTAHDLGAARMVSSRKDFIGRVMAERRSAIAGPANFRRVQTCRPDATAARRRALSAAWRPGRGGQ